jgi:hypothetical protein
MKKVLFIGTEASDFLNPLARELQETGYKVDLLELRSKVRKNNSIEKSYSEVLDYSTFSGKPIPLMSILRYLLNKQVLKNWINTIFINYLEGKWIIFKSLKNSLNKQNTKDIISSTLNSYDILNFHSLNPGTISFTNYIEAKKKIILSFWGSDLYQTSGLKNYYEQLRALQRADIITVLNYEMEKVVLAKFGSELKNKIIHTRLGMDEKIFDLIDDSKKNLPNLNFLRKYDIPENKIKITIGYSGNLVCNHILILNELKKIESKIKENIHFLVPMTYGNYSKEYLNEVIKALDQTYISYTLFDKYLSSDELVNLRTHSKIMIQMNKSDGFNTSVREALYAENILITAVWLPYSLLRLENILFYETDFEKLVTTLTDILSNYETIKNDLVMNTTKVKKLSIFKQNFQPWINIFNSF